MAQAFSLGMQTLLVLTMALHQPLVVLTQSLLHFGMVLWQSAAPVVHLLGLLSKLPKTLLRLSGPIGSFIAGLPRSLSV